ncbi:MULTISPECIES: formimidoylglutamate deiminase [unclassified Aliiroseovarius]|uniref:formimidoylglutamate deiminase n=1 Tax=unclassified Aliiroseovarius TaxID=2623558 RepID=UPI001567D590|nr:MULTISPECIES: formimidoylglutamate deiminase [unclassified Aliiroseovarius]NRP13227.1 8-oxoguanine deaminase [Aliiroseovarius sp. xm-d-517]NRP30249.1 8-oxoguanine deaminase [Aliiroseovarius sp. xm-m-314]NRP40298.1 8-oxoguanine deaminase [Aliiroseovarius sp. xm-m-339-2]NRP43039.1 8-oxoguanine deaminase [Aliiroseovarius sp. xm-m-378]NRP61304.1 8-oxoguanine deaminase [Aliiroseovarius sp. xm-a-151]
MKKIIAKQALTKSGWQTNVEIGLEKGRISYIKPAADDANATASLVLPAPLNLHSHAFQRAMSGLTEARGPDASDSFWSWRRLMYKFLDQLTPDQVQAIAAQVFLEMLEAGYASVAEFHYLHHDRDGKTYANLAEMSERIVEAASDVGIGLTLLPVLYQHGGCDARPLNGGQRRFGNDPDQFQRLHEGAARAVAAGPADFAIGVAPHSLRAVDAEGMARSVALGARGPIHMHLAEQVAEVEEVVAHLGARPTEWLLDNHDVDARWCLIHATQMTEAETRGLARSGAVAGLCPITESNLGDGIFNGTQFLADGGRVGFGSDSNVHIALFDELRTLEYSQRLRDRSRAALATQDRSTGRVLFDAANLGGAQAGGRDCGVLAPGMVADIIGLDLDNEWGANRSGDMALDTLIFGGHGQDCITDIWSAGRHVVKDGRHLARDRITMDFVKVMGELEQEI